MRRLAFGVAALVLLAPLLWAQDDTKTPKKANPPEPAKAKTPSEQFKAIANDFNKEQRQWLQAYQKAKTQEERQQLTRPDVQATAKRMMEFADTHAKEPEAVDALIWVVQRTPASDAGKKATKTLLSDYLESAKIAPLCQVLVNASDGEKKLHIILEKNPHREVQGLATYALVQRTKAMAKQTADKAKKEALEKETQELLERMAKDYLGVKYFNRDLGKLAKGELNEMFNLVIGKTAPEIEGEDIDGKKFKLSDYRGKVVMIDFWGHW